MEFTIKNLRVEKPNSEYQVRIDRGHSILCNPFKMHSENERDLVCEKYEKYFAEQMKSNEQFLNEMRRLYKIAKKYGKLELFCWCYPKRCHGETILNFLKKYLRSK